MALTQCTRHNTAGAMHLAQGAWHDALWHNALGTMHLAQSTCAMHLALYCSWHTQHNALGRMPFGIMPFCAMHLAQCTPGTMHLAQSTWTWHALGTMHLGAMHLEQCTWHNALGTWGNALSAMHLAQCTEHNGLGAMDLVQHTWHSNAALTLTQCTWHNGLDAMHLALEAVGTGTGTLAPCSWP